MAAAQRTAGIRLYLAEGEQLSAWLSGCDDEERHGQHALQQHEQAAQAVQQAKDALAALQTQQQQAQQQLALLEERFTLLQKTHADSLQQQQDLLQRWQEGEKTLAERRRAAAGTVWRTASRRGAGTAARQTNRL